MNRNVKSLLTAGLLLLHCTLSIAQQKPLYAGTKTPYPQPATKYTPPPKGYLPVFVNHVGRHGSRFMTKAGSDIALQQLFATAAAANGLTATGKRLQAMTNRFLTIEKDQYEKITLLGGQEQTAIGNRMRKTYNPVFKGQGLDVQTTFKFRTQQSAQAFLTAFNGYTGTTQFDVIAEAQDKTLRFYDLCPAYEAYTESTEVKQMLDSLDADNRTAQAAQRVGSRVFTPAFVNKLTTEGITQTVKGKSLVLHTIEIMDYLYELYSVQFSITQEMKAHRYTRDSIDFRIAFSQTDLDWLSFRDGAHDFLEKGPATNADGIQVKIAAPLLVDFLQTTDSALRYPGQKDAVLRFSHAETISPFAALLGIAGASTPANSIYQYSKYWQAANVIPLSANIQWIVYANGKDQLVKVLLNEREARLPIVTSTWPYYKWEAVKQYYEAKLHRLQVDENGDMLSYLKNLQ